MKKVAIVFPLLILLLIGSCAPDKKIPLEGTWELVYGEWLGHIETFPGEVHGGSIKFWSKNHFAFAGQLVLDTLIINSLGGGTYTLDGNRYEEYVLYSSVDAAIGVRHRILLEFKNDTLYQRWPADENWELAEEYSFEKYVRIE